MSAEREKFEAWFSNKYPETLKAAILEETDPKYVNESHGNVATRERLWECWQARGEARPSVSGLPEEVKRFRTWQCQQAHEEWINGEVGFHDQPQFVDSRDYDAQSSRIVELESEVDKWRGITAGFDDNRQKAESRLDASVAEKKS